MNKNSKLFLHLLSVGFLIAVVAGALAAAPTDRSVTDDSGSGNSAGEPKMGFGYFRATAVSIDSAQVHAGFDFLNARLFNNIFSGRTAYQNPYSVPRLYGAGGEAGITALSQDGVKAVHIHIAYYRAGTGEVSSVSRAQSDKIYTFPAVVEVASTQDGLSRFKDISQEGVELETFREYFLLRATDNPYFRYFGIRFGLGLSTDKSRMRGSKMSEVSTTANGVPSTSDYYPGTLPSGAAFHTLQMDYRQTNVYAIVGLDYRAPIGTRHEVALSYESLLLGISGGYLNYVETLVPTIAPNMGNPISVINYNAAISSGNTLEGPVGGWMSGQRLRAGYTFKPTAELGIHLSLGQTIKNNTLYTPKIKANGADQATSLLSGDTQEYLMKSVKSLGVSRLSIIDRRRDVSLEIQSRF